MTEFETLGDTESGWTARTETLSQFLRPIFEPARKKLNGGATMLCTPDGLNLCSSGFTQEQINKIATLTGSLVAVAEACVHVIDGIEEKQLGSLSLQSGNTQCVFLRVQYRKTYLLLLVAAENTPLGVILTVARNISEQVEQQFSS